MNYGLYLSASGVLTNMYRQDVFANNLANVNTIGFKPDRPAVHQRHPESVEGGFGIDVRHALLDKLGGGVLAGPQHVDFRIGPAQNTGNQLHAMLESPDTFFVTRVEGATGDELRFTRDGRFSRASDGTLVTTTGGHPVLGVGDQPIVIASGADVSIQLDGHVMQNGESVGRIQVTSVNDRDQLIKQGSGLFKSLEPGDPRTAAADTSIRAGFVEGSAVDAIQAMLKVVQAAKAVTGNANLIRYHDQTMDRAINTLGRVSA